jgi:hypothetical protein
MSLQNSLVGIRVPRQKISNVFFRQRNDHDLWMSLFYGCGHRFRFFRRTRVQVPSVERRRHECLAFDFLVSTLQNFVLFRGAVKKKAGVLSLALF